MRKLAASRIAEEGCAAFYEMLKKSERPLIYAGGGVINSGASEELRAFARTLRIPTITTLMGIGAMDTADDLSLHMVGMHGMAYAN
jgi:acetolactate synthase-1/2/3 large subunit